MNNGPECIPCCLRRVLKTADLATSDEWLHRKILAAVMSDLTRVDELVTPAEIVHGAARQTAKTLGVIDPYAEEKRRWIQETTSNADLIRDAVDHAGDPFLKAAELSVAANLLDCEWREEIVHGFSLKKLLEEVETLSFPTESIEELRAAVKDASRILFVHDTAGELFFDRLFIEKMEKPKEAVVSVVRESPILGDATAEDAAAIGLDQVARVIDPGVSCLGLPLPVCSQALREEYTAADLVITKGQSAYETLEGANAQINGVEKEVYFLLRVKCAVVARALGAGVGDCVIESN